jgi:hypothetical protein
MLVSLLKRLHLAWNVVEIPAERQNSKLVGPPQR